MSDVNNIIDSITYSFNDARNERRPSSKIRAVCLIPLLLISFLGFSQTYYPLDYNVDFKQNINVEGSIAQGSFFPLGELHIEGENIYFPNLPGSGDVVKWAAGYLTLGTVVSGDVTGLNEYEVLFGASDGSIDQDNNFTYTKTTNTLQIFDGDYSTDYAPGGLFITDINLHPGQSLTLASEYITFSDENGSGLTIKKDLSPTGSEVYNLILPYQLPTTTGQYLSVSGISGSDINLNWSLLTGASLTGLNPTEGLYGGSGGDIAQDAAWTYDETTDSHLILSDDVNSGFTVSSTDFSQTASFRYYNLGFQGVSHASNLTSDEIASYRAVHQFVQITPNPASWDGYTNITGGNGDDVINWVLPAAQGGANTYFKNDGSGNLSWATITQYSTETAQDDVAAMFTTDNGDIDFTYNDGTPDVAAQIKSGAIVNADINASASIDATKINTGDVSNTEFNYLDGVTSAIQTQLDAKTGIVATITPLTAQAASIGATTAYTTPAADGWYRINIMITVTQAATTSSTIGFQFKYTAAVDNVVKTWPTNNSNGLNQTNQNNTAATLNYSGVMFCKASTAIQYLTNYTSSGATPMQYSVNITIEKI